MKATHRLLRRAAFALGILCTGAQVFNMVAIPVFKEQVFLERDIISSEEMVILIGFVLVLIFNIVSLLWVLLRIRHARAVGKGDRGILALGTLCLILLMGEKVMADEIGREYLLGWEVIGEWIILYVFLAIQLLYNIVILRRVYRTCVVKGSEPGA